jgi:glycerol-3-phosphate acyltransferase PlsY
MMIWIVFLVAAYFLGAVPFGRIIGKRVARIDIQRQGSGNIGATNVARELGIGWGILTLVLDAAKGAIPVMAALAMDGERGLAEGAGLAAIVGHQFSVFMRFRGGKGVATALGIFCVLEPWITVAALGVFLGVVAVTDHVSMGSMAASCAMPVGVALLGGPPERLAAAVVMAGLIVWAHRENIRRLLHGEERGWRRARESQPRRSRSRSNSSSE